MPEKIEYIHLVALMVPSIGISPTSGLVLSSSACLMSVWIGAKCAWLHEELEGRVVEGGAGGAWEREMLNQIANGSIPLYSSTRLHSSSPR